MQYSQVLAFAASASAFLVVPEMLPPKSDDVEGEFKVLPVAEINPLALPPSIAAQTVTVPCAECPGEDATVRFDIEVHDNTRLLVNGFEVYPADDEPTGDMMATVSSMEGTEVSEHVLSWFIWWQVVEVDQDQGMHIIDHHLNVGSIGNLDVNSVALTTSLVVGPNGELMIADVAVPEPRPAETKPACDGLLCRVKDFFNQLTEGRMGCHKAHQDMAAVMPEIDDEPEQFEDYDEQSQDHDLGKMLKNVAAHIFLPVIMGITAGVGAAVLVMFLCSVIAFVARKITGREETRCSWTFYPSEVVVIEEAIDEDDEKAGLMNSQAPPPAYEEPVEKE